MKSGASSLSTNPRRVTSVRLSFVVWFLLLAAAAAPGQTDRRIETIETLRAKIDQDIAATEAEPEYSHIYLTELAVNKGNGSYPAVGIYRPVARFFYTYGDREKEPYPNRLLKIVVNIDRSDQKEHEEFLFNEAEQMVFYLEKKNEIERRIYFAAGRPIRFEENGKTLGLRARPQVATIAEVLKEMVRLVGVFRESLKF